MKLNVKKNDVANKLIFLSLISLLVAQLFFYDSRMTQKINTLAVNAIVSYYKKTLPDIIYLPDSLIDAKTGDIVEIKYLLKNKVKILNLLNTGCYKCIEILPNWDLFIKEFAHQDSVSFLFIASAPTRKYLKNILTHRMNLGFQVLYDSLNVLGKSNHINENPLTMLLDQNNKVILGGSPILHSKLKPLYIKKIKNLLKNEQGRNYEN